MNFPGRPVGKRLHSRRLAVLPLTAALTLSGRRGSRWPPGPHRLLPQKDELCPASPGPTHGLGNGCDRVAGGSACRRGRPRGLRTRPLTCNNPPGDQAALQQ